jgi:hypothetical protein
LGLSVAFSAPAAVLLIVAIVSPSLRDRSCGESERDRE